MSEWKLTPQGYCKAVGPYALVVEVKVGGWDAWIERDEQEKISFCRFKELEEAQEKLEGMVELLTSDG